MTDNEPCQDARQDRRLQTTLKDILSGSADGFRFEKLLQLPDSGA